MYIQMLKDNQDLLFLDDKGKVFRCVWEYKMSNENKGRILKEKNKLNCKEITIKT